jgi:hypothetical protein
MIDEVDAALEALVRRDALNGSRVDILFDAPNKEWVARRNAPTIDLYLYDIREDLPRRQLSPEAVRDATTGFVANRTIPARRYRLSYLLTAWTQRSEDEHRLLAACLAVLARNEFIPFDLVGGSLAASPFPVLLTVCLPPPQDRSIADVWSALGGELKPSLDIIATAPLNLNYRLPAGAPILQEPLLGVGGPGISPEVAARARGGNGHGPARRGPAVVQHELVRGAAIGAPKVPVATAATGPEPPARPSPTREGAGRRGSRGAQPAETEAREPGQADAGPEAPAAPVEPPLSDLGGGRIVRIRGMDRRER